MRAFEKYKGANGVDKIINYNIGTEDPKSPQKDRKETVYY